MDLNPNSSVKSHPAPGEFDVCTFIWSRHRHRKAVTCTFSGSGEAPSLFYLGYCTWSRWGGAMIIRIYTMSFCQWKVKINKKTWLHLNPAVALISWGPLLCSVDALVMSLGHPFSGWWGMRGKKDRSQEEPETRHSWVEGFWLKEPHLFDLNSHLCSWITV